MCFVTAVEYTVNIPPVLETNYKLTYVSGKDSRTYYEEQSLTIQIVQEEGTTAADLSDAPTALPLKWLTDNLVWVKQWPLTTEKLQALEQLQEQLNAQHIYY